MKTVTISVEEYNNLLGTENKPINDNEYLGLCDRAKGVVKGLKSKAFFTNRKTVISCDFRICPLMSRTKQGTLTSKTCHGCYSANILNVYKGTQEKLLALKDNEQGLADFEEGCQKIRKHLSEVTRLRFYSLADFGPEDMPFIKVAAKYFTVDIISKTLYFPNNRKHLIELFDMENVWISLSFNDQVTKYLKKVEALLDEYQPNNVNLNYTMNYKEENPDDEFYNRFAVLHFRNNDKRGAENLFKTVDESRTCAVFSGGGNRVKAHGSCHSCNNCHISHKDFANGKKPPIPSQIKE